jgi:hypothetical protein
VESSIGQRTPFGDVAEGAVAEDGGIERGEKVVVRRNDRAEIFLDKVGMIRDRLAEKEQKMMPCFASSSLNVVATDTLSSTASTATPERRFLFIERDAELFEHLAQFPGPPHPGC